MAQANTSIVQNMGNALSCGSVWRYSCRQDTPPPTPCKMVRRSAASKRATSTTVASGSTMVERCWDLVPSDPLRCHPIIIEPEPGENHKSMRRCSEMLEGERRGGVVFDPDSSGASRTESRDAESRGSSAVGIVTCGAESPMTHMACTTAQTEDTQVSEGKDDE